MPIYEYRCEKCGDFEITQRITDDPIGKCPTCKRKVKRLISSTSFQLKGSGWYVTDYARSGKGGGESSAKSESSGTSSSESKSDSTPSAKAETKPAKPSKSESKSSSAA
ncbi:MAG: zinc ribbon domain-containing protein [bacterium]|nr:zinc ribbon domain-containing protein [bacterium]